MSYSITKIDYQAISFIPTNTLSLSGGAGAQSVPVNRLVVGSIPTRGDEIFIYIYIFISSL